MHTTKQKSKDTKTFTYIHSLQSHCDGLRFVSNKEWPKSIALFLGSPSPFLNFTHTNTIREKSKERESLVWNHAHLWPPGHGHGGHACHGMVHPYHSRSATWIVKTSPTSHRGYAGDLYWPLSYLNETGLVLVFYCCMTC